VTAVPASLTIGGEPTIVRAEPLHLLAGQVANIEVLSSHHERMLYATDASLYQVEPLGVVLPHTPEAGAKAACWLLGRGIPVLPRGGGTALAGQTVNRAVVIDFSKHCRSIESIDAHGRRAIVQPGVVLDQLNAALAPLGLMFGPDVATSSHATIGGMVGNNSAGANSILYGRTVENLIALEVALPDGRVMWLREGGAVDDPIQAELAAQLWSIIDPLQAEIDARIPTILRHVDGYNLDLFLKQVRASTPGTFDRVNLAHLVCGAEGTLCTVLRAELALVPRPAHRGLAILGFASIDDALASVGTLLATGPSAVELVDDVIISMALRNREYAGYVQVMPQPAWGQLGAVLYVQYLGDDPDTIRARCDAVAGLVPNAAHRTCVDAASMEQAWKLRKAGEPLLHAVPGARKPVTFVEDTAVDPSRLPAFVKEFRAIVERHGTTAAYYAHASVGCLHIRPLIALDDDHDLSVMRAIAVEIAELVARHHGALSGEHGDGRVRTPLLRIVLGEPICSGLRGVKAVFDPGGLMNPGNLVDTDDPARITEHLRVRPLGAFVRVEPRATFFRFRAEEGLEHAASQCNGAGICRRTTPGGTMCPSYRVLLDERHTTRGRGNALRLAITGQLDGGRASWSDPATQQTLSLCLSCKACASECPSNVDLAKIKAEYTAQGFAERGRVPWRVRMRGRVRGLQRLGSRMAPLANAAVSVVWLRKLLQSVLGLATDRPLPSFGKDAALRMRGVQQPADAPTVLLFGDCFTQYGESDVAMDAVAVLNAFGYRVAFADAGCCARSLISTGMLAEALATVPRTARALRDSIERERAVAVLMLEPSCMSAIIDDWQDLSLAPGAVEDARAVAALVDSVEGFLERRWNEHPKRPGPAPGIDEAIAVHLHCHQKALWGGATTMGLLRRFYPRAEQLATGCCGMAGAFGYDASTADLSVRIARHDVLPALAERPNHLVCAPGTSCRHQVQDLAGRDALHPISLLRRALG
jgi:FAD/FMN-containing dehydrogenase/Fe-S oxidoreductase